MDWMFSELTFDPWITLNEDQILGQCSICSLEATTPAIMNICAKCSKPVHFQCLEQRGYGHFEYVTKLNLWKVGLICCSILREIKYLDQICAVSRVEGVHKFSEPKYIEHHKKPRSHNDTTITTNEMSYLPQKELIRENEQSDECLFCPTSADL